MADHITDEEIENWWRLHPGDVEKHRIRQRLRAAEKQLDEAVAALRSCEEWSHHAQWYRRACCDTNLWAGTPHKPDCRIGKILEAHRG